MLTIYLYVSTSRTNYDECNANMCMLSKSIDILDSMQSHI